MQHLACVAVFHSKLLGFAATRAVIVFFLPMFGMKIIFFFNCVKNEVFTKERFLRKNMSFFAYDF